MLASNQAVTGSTSTPRGSLVARRVRHRVVVDGPPRRQVADRVRRAPVALPPMSIDVTDATFQTEVVDRSEQVPVVVDLWARVVRAVPTLGPILEKVDRRDRGQGRAGQGQRRREPADPPGVPGPVDPGRVRAQGRQGRRRLRRRPARGRRPRVRRPACCRPRPRTTLADLARRRRRGVAAPGPRPASPATSEAIVALAELLVAQGDDAPSRGAGAARADPRDGRHPPGRRPGPRSVPTPRRRRHRRSSTACSTG